LFVTVTARRLRQMETTPKLLQRGSTARGGRSFDRSYILYNIALIHASNGEHEKAFDYYEQALSNPRMIQALNIAVIYHYQGEN